MQLLLRLQLGSLGTIDNRRKLFDQVLQTFHNIAIDTHMDAAVRQLVSYRTEFPQFGTNGTFDMSVHFKRLNYLQGRKMRLDAWFLRHQKQPDYTLQD